MTRREVKRRKTTLMEVIIPIFINTIRKLNSIITIIIIITGKGNFIPHLKILF
jgi:hypothetical protein